MLHYTSLLLPLFLLPQINRHMRKWYLNTFFLKSLENPLSQFMLCKVLVNKFLYLTDKCKIKGTVSKAGNETYKRLRVSEQSWNFTNSLFSFLNEYFFYLFGIRRITHSYRNQQRHPFFG